MIYNQQDRFISLQYEMTSTKNKPVRVVKSKHKKELFEEDEVKIDTKNIINDDKVVITKQTTKVKKNTKTKFKL